MKYLFSALAIALLISGLIQTAAAHHGTKAFTDLSTQDEYYVTILELHARGIVNGNGDNTVTPNNPLNRAELVVIVNRAAGTQKQTTDKNCFQDVREEWFAADVCAAARLGFIKGYADGFFRPTQEVTSGESAKILLNTLLKRNHQDLSEASKEIEQQEFFFKKFDLNASIKRNEAFERLLRIVHHKEQSPEFMDQMDQEGNLFNPDIDPIKNQLGVELPIYVEFNQASYDYFLGKNPIILFFHAPWCPLCRASDEVLNEALPSLGGGVIWMKVDYDTQTELKKKYGVTYQDTFILIDGSGEVVGKKNSLRSAESAQEWMLLTLQNQ